uniref:Uncharacterized protein n=1 Tax=Amphimedon queenslandica TaxID=400682 RepID=A0A1X7TCP5_AMPQE
MDIPDIGTLVAGSTLPLCVGIASFAVGCVLKYQEASVPAKPEFFEPRCNDDYVKLKKNLCAGTYNIPVLVQGRVTEAQNKGRFGGFFDPAVHKKKTTRMKDVGKSVAGKATKDRSRGYYAEISETIFSIPFHLQNKNIESAHKDKNIILTVVDIDKSLQFTEVLQRWPEKSKEGENYDILPYGSTIAVLGAARLEHNEITIVPTKVGKSVQSLLPKESIIGSNALLVVGGVLIAVGIGFFVYKIWKARRAMDGGNRRDSGDDHD